MALEGYLGHSAPWAGQIASSLSMRCRSFVFRHPLTLQNSAALLVVRFRSSPGLAPTSFTALYSITFGTTFWMQTTGSTAIPTVHHFQRRESGKTILAGRTAGQSLKIERFSFFPMKDFDYAYLKPRSAQCPISTRGKMHPKSFIHI